MYQCCAQEIRFQRRLFTRISTLWHTPYQISKTTVRNSWFANELYVFLQLCILHTRFQRRLFGIHGSLMNYTYFYTLAHSLPGFKDDCSEFMVRNCSTRISTLWHNPYQHYLDLKNQFCQLPLLTCKSGRHRSLAVSLD